jgi:hypothetical protein
LRVDDRVMPYQRLAILGDVDVEFQSADAYFERLGERPKRFAGRLATAAGVGLQVERRQLRGRRRRQSCRDNCDGNQLGAKAPSESQSD